MYEVLADIRYLNDAAVVALADAAYVGGPISALARNGAGDYTLTLSDEAARDVALSPPIISVEDMAFAAVVQVAGTGTTRRFVVFDAAGMAKDGTVVNVTLVRRPSRA